MTEPRHYTPEVLSEYLDSEVELIRREKENPDNWKVNKNHFSQFMVRTDIEEGNPNGIYSKPSEEL